MSLNGRAKQLLRTTTLSLTEIAGQVGLATTKAFRAAFLREMGELPAKWRNKQRRADV